MKDSFILFTSYKETVDCMTDVSAGLLFKMILNYESGNEPLCGLREGCDTDTAYIAFTFIKRQLDSMNEKYEKTVEKQREAGKKGAEKRWGKRSEAIGSDSEPIAKHGDPIKTDSKPIGADSLYEYEYDIKEKPSKEGKKKSDLNGLEDPALLAAVKDYENHRKKIKAPLTDMSKAVSGKLTNMPCMPGPIGSLSASLISRWQNPSTISMRLTG